MKENMNCTFFRIKSPYHSYIIYYIRYKLLIGHDASNLTNLHSALNIQLHVHVYFKIVIQSHKIYLIKFKKFLYIRNTSIGNIKRN